MLSSYRALSALSLLLPLLATTLLPPTAASYIPAPLYARALPAPAEERTAELGKRAKRKGSVFAHFIVGNAINYTDTMWTSDFKLAQGNGIDAFALNVGKDDFTERVVDEAFAAAELLSPPFKLFLSLDMASLADASVGDVATLTSRYASKAAHLMHKNRPLVSTFAGEVKGQQWWVDWKGQVQSSVGKEPFFVPAFFGQTPSAFVEWDAVDGLFNWNGAWPQCDCDITAQVAAVGDSAYTDVLGSKAYMAAVSPWFFTHYPNTTLNKNWVYRSDDHLFNERWEQLDKVGPDFVEVLTWNDFGESHYIGPVQGSQPDSQAWVDGFPHTEWLTMQAYYIDAYKSGKEEAGVRQDAFYFWYRPHPRDAVATNDTVGRPANSSIVDDNVYGAVFATAPGQATISVGSNQKNFDIKKGANLIKNPFASGKVVVTLSRNGATILTGKGDVEIVAQPRQYNYNAWVGSAEDLDQNTPQDPFYPLEDSSLSGGAIAGIVIGVVAGLALIAAAIFFFIRRRRAKNSEGELASEAHGLAGASVASGAGPMPQPPGRASEDAPLVVPEPRMLEHARRQSANYAGLTKRPDSLGGGYYGSPIPPPGGSLHSRPGSFASNR